MRYHSRSLLLWNLALDQNSAPHTGGCGDCRGVVTLARTEGDGVVPVRVTNVTKNVEYYSLSHIGSFVGGDSDWHYIPQTKDVDSCVSVAAFESDDRDYTLVLNSQCDGTVDVSIVLGRATVLNVRSIPRGVMTLTTR